MADRPDVLVFSYGTLQRPEVQLDMFGRLVESDPDILPGYTVDYIEISDTRLGEVSGLDVHPVVRATGNPRDKLTGLVLYITEDELEAADEYEAALFRRGSATLASGRTAWLYLSS